MPLEERKFKDDYDRSFGDEGKQADICMDIMQKTGKYVLYLGKKNAA